MNFDAMGRQWLAGGLALLLLTSPAAHAELGMAWRLATPEEKAERNPAMTNMFYAFHRMRPLIAMAGEVKLTEPITTPEERATFMADIVAGAISSGLKLRNRREEMVKGKPVVECVFEIPDTGKYSLLAVCTLRSRYLNLSILSSQPMTWEDPEAQALLKELLRELPLK